MPGKSVTIALVHSHVEISGIERADQNAKEANQSIVPTSLGVPFSDFYPQIGEHILEISPRSSYDDPMASSCGNLSPKLGYGSQLVLAGGGSHSQQAAYRSYTRHVLTPLRR